LIDWDFAHPGPAWDDVADVLRFVAPFVDDEQAVRWMRHPAPPSRGRRIEIFLDAYGAADHRSITTVVDGVLVRLAATADLVARLARDGLEPQAGWVADGWLDRLTEQARWVDRHRSLFEP